MKYEAIEANSSTFEVKRMCKILELKAPNYYRWKKQKEKKYEKVKEELEFIGKVEKAFLESDKTYGYRMIRKELLKKEVECGGKMIQGCDTICIEKKEKELCQVTTASIQKK